MTSWTRDAASDPPRVIYTPSDGNIARVILDPEAPSDRRITAEFRYLFAEGESVADLDAGFGVG